MDGLSLAPGVLPPGPSSWTPVLGIRQHAHCLQKWARWRPGWVPDAEVAGLGGVGGASNMREWQPAAQGTVPFAELAAGSWQLGAGRAPPKQVRAGRAGPVSGQGGDRADRASLGLVLPRGKVGGQWSLLGRISLG